MENNEVMLGIAGPQQGQQQIATFANRVREIVPAYRLRIPEDETITIVKNAVENSTYAPWSENDTMEGMYIQGHLINDGNSDKTEAGYADNQLVAIVDLNYRFLTPINPKSDDPDSPEDKTTSHIISDNGCVEINNKDNTINRGDTYIARLTTKEGFARLPKGRIEMQVGNDGGEDDWVIKDSWSNGETQFDINIPNVTGNLRFVFEEACVYNLTINRTLNGESWENCPFGEQPEIIEKHCGEIINVNEVIKKTTSGYLIESVTPDISSEEVSYCTNTEITVNYIPADSRIVVRWIDIEHNDREIISAIDTLGFGEELNPLDYEDDYTFEGEYEGYEVKSINPSEIIRGDGREHTIILRCGLKEFTVTYQGDDHVTIERGPVTVKYGQDAPNRTFTIIGDYSVSESHTGTATVIKDDENNTISVTGVKSNVVVTLSSAENVRVTSITADQIDAMGGVKLTAHLSNDTEDSNPEHFSINSYKIGTEAKVEDVNQSNISQVYDYVAKDLVDKKVISNLEWPDTSSSTRNVLLGVTYNQYGSTENEISTTQRAEVYGHYEGGLKSNSNSSDLKTVDATTSNWKTNYLVDFGDSSNMYGDTGPTEQNPDKVKIGLDIYNKDITPYYIPGTDIGENPLDHLDDKAKFTYSGSTKPIINYNKPRIDNEEHNHILWYDFHSNNPSIKGRIFTDDSLSSETSGCGSYDSDCGCSEHKSETGLTKFYTLEARANTNSANTIWTTTSVDYKYYYDIPQHKYGKDSISYYHCNNEKYSSKIKDEIFKDDKNTIIDFSYPVHIYTNVSSSNYYETNYSNIPNESYKFETLRWESSSTNYIMTPDDSDYNYYGNDCYYDYNNKVRTGLTTFFDPYSDDYYFEDEDKGKELNQLTIESNEPNDTGRLVTEYYTLMSPQKQVRPIITEIENPTEEPVEEYRFIKLDGIYNGADYQNDRNSSKIILKDLSEYINDKDKHTTYISSNFENPGQMVAKEPTALGKDDYLYSIGGTNTDYSQQYLNNAYSDLSGRISETPDNYYPYRWYNMSTGVQFGQYCNSNSNSSHYLRNNDYAKYVACASEFGRMNYYYYRPNEGQPGYTSDWSDKITWWVNNFKNVVSIEGNSNPYTLTLKNGTVTQCNKDTLSDSTSYETIDGQTQLAFFEQQLTLPYVYTNADTIKVEFLGGHCNSDETTTDTSNCGIGSFKVRFGSTESDWIDPSAETNNYFEENNPIPEGSQTKDTTIYITANTNTPALISAMENKTTYDSRNEYISNNYDYYHSNVKTGGGRFKVTATWDNEDSRYIIIDIGGSCDRSPNNNHPNKEGCKIEWKDFIKYYHYNNRSWDNRYISGGILTFEPVVETVNNEPQTS